MIYEEGGFFLSLIITYLFYFDIVILSFFPKVPPFRLQ